MSFPLIFDIIVAFLLVATIVFAVILNRKLSLIHNSRDDIQNLLDHFSKALARAEDGVSELRRTASSVGDGLDKQINKAAALKDDLVFLCERGNALANSLEDGIRKTRKTASPERSHAAKVDMQTEASSREKANGSQTATGGLR